MLNGKTDPEDYAVALLVHYESMYAYALSLAHDHDNAVDLLHDSIVKALRSIHKINDLSSLRTWFRRIILHSFIDQYRASSGTHRTFLVGDVPGDSRQPGVLSRMAKPDERDLVLRDAVSGLPETQRVLIDLHYFEDLSIPEIVVRTGLCEGTICSRLARARSRLRHVLLAELPELRRDELGAAGRPSRLSQGEHTRDEYQNSL